MRRAPLFDSRPAYGSETAARAADRVAALQEPMVARLSRERLLRYLAPLCETDAPSTAALALRGPVLERLWREDGLTEGAGAKFLPDYRGSGELVVETGPAARKPVLFVAHLDTISYLVAADGMLAPNCLHLTQTGRRDARVLRYDPEARTFRPVAKGALISHDGIPRLEAWPGLRLAPGDRVVPTTPFFCTPGGELSAHLDNAGGVAALAACVPLFAALGIDAAFAFPDDEEGPVGQGNQMMARGTARLVAAAGADLPRLTVVADMQQVGPATLPGGGAVLSEHSGLASGAVTPPPLYAAAAQLFGLTRGLGIAVRASDGTRISRSDDISLMLRRREILLLGFPGADRHFDTGPPSGHIDDIIGLARGLLCAAALAVEIEAKH